MEVKMLYFCYIYLVLTLTTKAGSNILTDSILSSVQLFSRTVEHVLNVPNSMTSSLCSLKTDELIRYYGYTAEKHQVITKDGYILTLFRCNSEQDSLNKNVDNKKKAVILQHGLLGSSDDFSQNIPEQSLPYILADAGYDVFITNSRGNVYSRKHISKDPENPFSGFWHFSWFEMGIFDHPAVIDYVLDVTNNSALYYVGHSQGTTSLMVLLSEKPEYNEKIRAASLMAPVGYMNHSDWLLRSLTYARHFLEWFQGTEFLPRTIVRTLPAAFCNVGFNSFCDSLLNLLFGPSSSQRNDTMVPSYICHTPSGASINQMFHYGLEMRYGYFGKYMRGTDIPQDFELWRITTPLALHYSLVDRLVSPIDVKRLILQLKSVEYVQMIDEKEFNHIDFIWGVDAAQLIYSNILNFFDLH